MTTSDPLIGQKLGDYEIADLLGRGGMARVYKGYDSVLARYAAIKVIEPNLLASEDEADYTERFLREARAIARLDHPRVVRIYQFGQSEDESLYYMAMSFITGRDLREILKELNRQKKRLSNAHILRILRDIASALDYAHRQNVIHRDVKPSNIMVTSDGHAVLTDFGLALNAQEGSLGNSFGSVHYIAPEQAVSSSQAVPQSDLYSLGVVLYEMLTGRVPFEDNSAMSVALKHISDLPPPPSTRNAELTTPIDAILMKALSKSPEERYPTGLALIQALEQAFLASESDEVAPAVEVKASATTVSIPPMMAAAQEKQSTFRNRTSTDEDLEATLVVTPLEQARVNGSLDDRVLKEEVIQSPVRDDTPATMRTSQFAEKWRQRGYVGIVASLVVVVVIAFLFATMLRPGDNAGIDQDTIERTDAAILAGNVDAVETTDEAASELESTPTLITGTARSTAAVEMGTESANAASMNLPDIIQASETDADLALRYDGRTLVVYNRSERRLNVSDLEYVRLNADGSDSITYRSREWAVEGIFELSPGNCLQVWTMSFVRLEEDDPPADICQSRQGIRQTVRPFWVTTQDHVYFEVREFDNLLARCAVIPRENNLRPENPEKTTCFVDLDVE
jgi:serine/threonine protein kinase